MRFRNRSSVGCSLLGVLLAAMAAAADVYRIQAGDTVEVQYRLTPEFNATAAVQPDGTITLPLVGRLAVAGTTSEEAGDAIRGKASARLRDPEVTVILRDYVKPTYTVAGEVGKPGQFECRGEITLARALAAAGWVKETSKHSQVLLVRRVNADWGEVRSFDVRAYVNHKSFTEDPVIKPGDMIVVPQSTLSKLDRYFRWASFTNLGFLLR